jgi:hypothetical protein
VSKASLEEASTRAVAPPGASPAASSDPQWGSRAVHVAAKAAPGLTGVRTCPWPGPSGVRGAARAQGRSGTGEARLASLVSKDRRYKPVVKVCPASCHGLAGVSPARVVAKQPGSWWPAEGETRLSKRHDKGPLGVEQATSPYVEEPCSLVMVTTWGPSLSSLGEGRGWRGDLGYHSAYAPTGVRRAEWLHSPSRNRRDPSRHRQFMAAACQVVVPGSGEPYKQRSCEVGERRAEVGAGRSSDDRRKNRNRPSEGPVAGCAARLEGLWACQDQWLFTHPPLADRPRPTFGRRGHFANVVASRNAGARLPGGKPDEGELHVRFGGRAPETERPRRSIMAAPGKPGDLSPKPTYSCHRASARPYSDGGQRESDGDSLWKACPSACQWQYTARSKVVLVWKRGHDFDPDDTLPIERIQECGPRLLYQRPPWTSLCHDAILPRSAFSRPMLRESRLKRAERRLGLGRLLTEFSRALAFCESDMKGVTLGRALGESRH